MFSRTDRFAIWSTVLTVGVLSLSACTFSPGGQTATAAPAGPIATGESFEPTAEPSDSTDGSEGCTSHLKIRFAGPGSDRGYLPEELEDQGPSEYASGAVGLDADGHIETYIVQPGDTMVGIGERFCIDYVTVAIYNDIYPAWEISPGDLIVLHP